MNQSGRIKKQNFKQIFEQLIQQSNHIAISGHIRPDGDCIGSCMGLYNYIRENYTTSHAKCVDVFLEHVPDVFSYIDGVEHVNEQYDSQKTYDLFISLDNGSLDRLGQAKTYFETATTTMNIDHHISNTEFADYNYIESDASSTCEVLCTLFEEEKIDVSIATALYTGIVHDTGVFKHTNTTRRTMECAGLLLEKGIPSSKIIDETFFQKTYVQNQILGRCLLESILVSGNRCIVSTITRNQLEFYQASAHDLEGIVDQLRITKGVEVAILIHEIGSEEYKVSMRSNGSVNVSKIATFYGGGGHIKAAGCTMYGSIHDVINNLTLPIERQLKEK